MRQPGYYLSNGYSHLALYLQIPTNLVPPAGQRQEPANFHLLICDPSEFLLFYPD
jgi:hypothetical protein